MAPELIVPHHAAGQADIPGGQHPLAPITVFLPQARVNLIYLIPGEAVGQLRIQRVDALHDAHPTLQLQRNLFRLPVLCEEVEFRQLSAAGGNQFVQAALNLIHVQRGDVLVILAAVRQTGILVQVFIKIVQADHLGYHAAQPQCLGQLVSRGGFAGGRGPGEHDHRAAAGQHLAGGGVHPALIFVLAVAGKAGRTFGGGIDQTDLNQSFRNPDSGHRMHSLLLCGGESRRSLRCIPPGICS